MTLWPGGDGFDLEQDFWPSQAGDPDDGLRGRVVTAAAPYGLGDCSELVEVGIYLVRPE